MTNIGNISPPIEVPNLFWEELREAMQQFKSGSNGGREGAIHALEIVMKFLGQFDVVRDEALNAPLARLWNDLMSLDEGMVSPMLRPKKKSGRARADSFYDGMKAIV